MARGRSKTTESAIEACKDSPWVLKGARCLQPLIDLEHLSRNDG